MRRLLLATAVVLLVAACAAPPDPCVDEGAVEAPSPQAPIGVVVIPPNYDTSAEGFGAVVARAEEADVALLSVGYAPWSETEPSPGTIDLSAFDGLLEATDGTDFEFVLDVSTPVVPAGIDVPADLTFTDFEDPVLQERYLAYLDGVLAWMPDRTRYLTLHVEGATEHVAQHPDHRAGLCDFATRAVEHVRAQRPDVLVGVYWRYEDDDIALRTCITGAADYLGLALVLNPPESQLLDVDRILDEAMATVPAGQQVAVVEAGWPSAERFGSSEACQAAFVDRVLGRADQRLAFLSYYTVFDEDEAFARAWIDQAFAEMSEGFRADLAAWLGSVGLVRADGTPKEGWARFTAR